MIGRLRRLFHMAAFFHAGIRLPFAVAVAFCLTAASGVAFGHGAYHDVVADLNAKLAVTPGDADLRFRLAAAHVEHGEWQACLDEVAKVGVLSGGTIRTTYLSGKALAGEGKLLPALADLDAFLAAEPGHQFALIERARVRVKLGQIEAGLADYDAALATPAPAELYIEAIEALRRNDRTGDAFVLAEAAVKETGGDPAALLCAIDCATSLGRTDEAVGHLDQLMKKWPRPEPWMQRKAEILAAAGRREEAKVAWRELHDHLLALPNLERAQPFLQEPLMACRRALGLSTGSSVVAPPASPSP